MKRITLKCELQFDVPDNIDTRQSVFETIDLINLSLQRSDLSSAPQILTTAIDNSDIKEEKVEEEDF